MSVASFASFCFIEHFHLNELCLLMAGNDHLGNALAVVDDKIFLGEIDEQNTYFSTVVGINSAWRIEYGNPFFQSKTATRTYLCFIAFWQCNMKARGDETTLQRT